jgi:hypothetical protein
MNATLAQMNMIVHQQPGADAGTAEAALLAGSKVAAHRPVDGYVKPFEFLTADSLLAYCAMKLRSLDSQVQTAFASQKMRGDVSTALTDLQQTFDRAINLPNPGDGEVAAQHHAERVTKINAAFDAAIAKAGGPDTPIGQRIKEQRDDFNKNATGAHHKGDEADIHDTEFAGYVKTLGAIQKDLNQEGELEMINLQSLMSMRQQAIQMCSNMVAGLGQSATAVAQNIGK